MNEQPFEELPPPAPEQLEAGGDVLAQYFRGIAEQLRAQIDFIATFFRDPDVVADGSAHILRDLVRRFIPGRYGVAPGIVFDRLGNESRACDLVVYDTQLYPNLLSAGAAHLFPVDFVYAVVDIRPRLTSDTVREALGTIASVRRLEIVRDEFLLPQARDGGLSVASYRPGPPLGFVFSFDSSVKQAQTFKEWFTPRPDQNAQLHPTLVGCLDQGVIRAVDEHSPAATGPRAYTLPVMKNERDYIATVFRADTAVHEGAVYPVKQVRGNYALIDRSRVLLFFVLLMNDLLAQKRINPALRFTDHFLHGPLASVVEI